MLGNTVHILHKSARIAMATLTPATQGKPGVKIVGKIPSQLLTKKVANVLTDILKMRVRAFQTEGCV